MPSRVTCWFRIIAVSLVLGLSGCSDDNDPAGPESGFVLTVEVTTVAGEPVADLRGALSPDLDNVNWPYDKASDLPPGVPIESLRILDVAGTVDDETCVPAFFDIEPMEILDDDGNVIGTETITTRTRLTLLAGTGAHQVVVFDAEPVPQTLAVIWDPR